MKLSVDFGKKTNGERRSGKRKIFITIYSTLIGLGAAFIIPSLEHYQAYLIFLGGVAAVAMGVNGWVHQSYSKNGYNKKQNNEEEVSPEEAQ